LEASKPEYFVDGFLLRHFGIWPQGNNKDDLFYEQKVFLIYLMGVIPELSGWRNQVSYEIELAEIKNLSTVEISQSDIDIAKIQGRSLDALKKERLATEKMNKINELRNKYGLQIIQEEPKRPEGLPEKVQDRNPQEKLWDLLQGKGLTTDGL